jgi:hypothetical protein
VGWMLLAYEMECDVLFECIDERQEIRPVSAPESNISHYQVW